MSSVGVTHPETGTNQSLSRTGDQHGEGKRGFLEENRDSDYPLEGAVPPNFKCLKGGHTGDRLDALLCSGQNQVLAGSARERVSATHRENITREGVAQHATSLSCHLPPATSPGCARLREVATGTKNSLLGCTLGPGHTKRLLWTLSTPGSPRSFCCASGTHFRRALHPLTADVTSSDDINITCLARNLFHVFPEA